MQVIEIPFLLIETLLAVIWITIRVILCIRRGTIDWHQELLSLLMLINVAVIVRFTMHPFSMVDGHVQPLEFHPQLALTPRLNLIPFTNFFDFESTSDILINIIGNPAMFIPTGILLPIVYPRLDTFAKVVGVGALMSLTIEIIQLPFYSRVSDINDIILNTLGVVIGYGIYALVRSLKKSRSTYAPRHAC